MSIGNRKLLKRVKKVFFLLKKICFHSKDEKNFFPIFALFFAGVGFISENNY